jgi:hypothetical protein
MLADTADASSYYSCICRAAVVPPPNATTRCAAAVPPNATTRCDDGRSLRRAAAATGGPDAGQGRTESHRRAARRARVGPRRELDDSERRTRALRNPRRLGRRQTAAAPGRRRGRRQREARRRLIGRGLPETRPRQKNSPEPRDEGALVLGPGAVHDAVPRAAGARAGPGPAGRGLGERLVERGRAEGPRPAARSGGAPRPGQRRGRRRRGVPAGPRGSCAARAHRRGRGRRHSPAGLVR